MAEINRDIVHKGSGPIFYQGEQVGVADEVGFIFHKVGLATESESENTCYGTVTGKLTKRELVDEFNSPRPTPSTLDLTVSDPGKEPFHVVIEDVEFIDDIPPNGALKDVEFHGVAVV